ncbi:acyl-CoA dehydrogenase domain-containing protein [Besnoitia besnoiti]|uniref:Acyl-CoA dehydrogenase domain-containing protein n=1 Tax=Besnoitia besnoiti TaxID=94643 RepID=A0A2A9MQM9_BESBE|nr:acyl-CoA dehydrogenase domain-containing protein [Besnoitia besnoiti]PFH38623.1 acyl-CoA dehydrogenase domain-containing protein [Besnoitia besnoiti]
MGRVADRKAIGRLFQLSAQVRNGAEDSSSRQKVSGDKLECEQCAVRSRSGGGPVYALDFLDFHSLLTPGEGAFRKSIEDIMNRFVKPAVLPLYESATFDNSLVDVCKKFGPAGLQIKGYGCPGLTHSEAILMAIEMARVDASFATFYLVHCGLAMQSIAVAGSDEQKAFWLPQMSRLECIGSFGLTEPEHGSDATGLKTSAKKVEGGWLLNGQKRWIGNATFSDIVIVWARDVDTGKIRAFIVEKHFVGYSATKIENKVSLRIVQNADIVLEDCFVPDSHRLEKEGFGGATAQVLESSRAVVAAECAGVLLGAYDNALKYCTERRQFRRELASFQLVQERLMRVLGMLQASLLLVLRLGRLMDEGKPNMMAHIALAKATCSRMAREGISLCREVLGGNGIVTDFGVAKFHADVEALYTYEGTYDINMLIAGRAVTGRSAFT